MLRIRLKFRAFLSSHTKYTHLKGWKTKKKEENTHKKEEDTHLSVRNQQFSKSFNVYIWMCVWLFFFSSARFQMYFMNVIESYFEIRFCSYASCDSIDDAWIFKFRSKFLKWAQAHRISLNSTWKFTSTHN